MECYVTKGRIKTDCPKVARFHNLALNVRSFLTRRFYSASLYTCMMSHRITVLMILSLASQFQSKDLKSTIDANF